MLKYGFANTMFTLWDVTTSTVDNGYTKYKVTDCRFIKNISKSLDKVKELYPDIEYDETLKGHSGSFTIGGSYEKIERPEDCFNFGKYENTKIEECSDYGYLMWYFNNDSNHNRREIIKNILEPLGYGIQKWADNVTIKMLDPEEYKLYIERNQKIEDAKVKISNGDLNFFCESNPNESGEIYAENLITYKFTEVKECWYQGWNYYIPVLNGKGKRIKNKNIKVTEFEVIDFEKRIVKLLNFEIEK